MSDKKIINETNTQGNPSVHSGSSVTLPINIKNWARGDIEPVITGSPANLSPEQPIIESYLNDY